MEGEGGVIRMKEDGLFLVYAQVCYFNLNSRTCQHVQVIAPSHSACTRTYDVYKKFWDFGPPPLLLLPNPVACISFVSFWLLPLHPQCRRRMNPSSLIRMPGTRPMRGLPLELSPTLSYFLLSLKFLLRTG